MDGLNTRFAQLYNAAAFPLTSVGGTANAVTATLVPDLTGAGLLDGMGFTITWAASNTGGMTLALNGGSPVPVVGPLGLALPAGSVGSGLRSVLTYAAGRFLVVSPTLLSAGGGAGAARYFWQYTASTTWVKPDGLSPDTLVLVEAWGAGGGGSSGAGGGGGGGGYMRREFRAGDLPGTVTVTVGAGGAVGAAGGNTLFGAFVTGYGGGFGNSSNPSGGGGGGSNEIGGNAAPSVGGIGGFQGGGNGDILATQGQNNATGVYGGGGGGIANGGRSVFGGGGGGVSAGGLSLYGGNGGALGVAGSARGGGGGRQAAGGRGEVRVWI